MTTTATKPPPHGSEARYKGSNSRPPCRCRRCVTGWTQAGQRREMLRLAGKPASLTPTEVAAVIAHIHTCQRAGMSQCLIGRKADVAQSTISRLLSRPGIGCLRTQGERILTVRPGDFDDHSDRPSTGTVRRIRGLYYAGHGPLSITQHAPLSLTLITEIAGAEYPLVTSASESAIKAAAVALATVTGNSRAAKARALRERWAPIGAWDDIDDPAARPDWTGHCGTDHGWWLHTVNRIPACLPCNAAHQQWKNENAHLTNAERWAEIGRAKAAASNRGAAIAADGRELLAHGVHIDQAAARLGITRQHLQQELIRHPEDMEAAA